MNGLTNERLEKKGGFTNENRAFITGFYVQNDVNVIVKAK